MNASTKSFLRWIAVLPGAVIAGLLATLPLHWILYFTLANGETISGVNIEPIEHAIYPFVIALAFILAGVAIAPSRKMEIAISLAVLYVIFALSAVIFGMINGVEPSLEIRSIGPVIGLVLGLYIAWRKSRV